MKRGSVQTTEGVLHFLILFSRPCLPNVLGGNNPAVNQPTQLKKLINKVKGTITKPIVTRKMNN